MAIIIFKTPESIPRSILVTTKQFGVQHTTEFKTPLDLSRLSKGNYVLRIVVNDKTCLNKSLIQ